MMSFAILADEVDAALGFLLFVVPIGLLLSAGLLVVSATVGRRRWWALLLIAIPVIASLYLFLEALSADAALSGLYLGLPGIILGLIAFCLWCKRRMD